ncbi:HDOD domain-containing protein [Actomonas aquatica]|uniref:HDOD domain-containing protein n=1 Tax=Actomonas aquatica TaxID=2866162 RepID=A0ABZ1C6Q7_9BACT|nr:HDOD domain-containing protein [Opitutus sp. WL0086]WRQ87050.1 HDOD domain-containing protein [Opitutus sp. WL0086]
MREELASQTIKTIDTALKSGQVASMPELVRIIRALSKDEGSVSIHELADLINQDSTILTRVIAAANTFGYNPTNIEISTVTDAIHTVGFNRVRMLAMSLMLLDHAGRTNSSYEQRQMASISLTSGIVAQVMAEHAGVMNPETAFVCASLRNFGRLLLGTFMVHEFREALAAAEAGEGDAAFQRVFGLTPYALGYELLKSAHLPKPILNAVRQFEPPPGPDFPWSERILHQLATFSLTFSEMALDGDLPDSVFSQRQQDLIKKAGRDFPFLLERAPNILKEAEQKLGLLSAAAGSAAIGSVGRERLRHRSRATPISGKPELPDPVPPSYLPPGDAHAAPGINSPRGPGGAPLDSRDGPPAIRRRTAIEQALEALENAPHPTANPLPNALNAVWKTLRPQDLFFCGLDSSGRAFRILVGQGPLADRLGERTLFRRSERNAFFLCHERLINLSVQDIEDDRVFRHLPDWLKGADAPRSFLALPVHHQRLLQGILFVGWSTTRDSPFGNDELAPIQALFEVVAQHTNQRQSNRFRAVA